jgi:hypothetical protein
MQTIYRLKAQEIGSAFLKSLKTLFAGQEVEIIVKSVEPNNEEPSENQKRLLKFINENRNLAPVIAPDIDIRGLIDDAQYPS